MSYYTRVFCTSPHVPSPADVLLYSNVLSDHFKLVIDEETIDSFSNGSMAFEMNYKSNMQPIVVEINPVDNIDPVGREEIKEFIADIGFAGFSSAKRKVINHLEKTNFIVACQLLSDIDDDGYEANSCFLHYFLKNCGGMLHADGEGFYNDDMTILLADK